MSSEQPDGLMSKVMSTTQAPASSQDNDPIKPAEEQHNYLEGKSLYSIVFAILLVCLMISLDISVLATSVPKITDDFGTIKDVGWYSVAFSFCNSALQPLTGKFFTYFNTKWAYLSFVAIFEIGSLVCATAPNSPAFVVGRAIAGIGGSGLANGALSIIGFATPPEKRPTLMGLVMSFFASGQLVGPLIGGALTQHASWRWCFYINLPVGGLTLLFMVLIPFPDNTQRIRDWKFATIYKAFDITGFLLFGPASIMLLLALEWAGTTYAWHDPITIGLLTGAGVTAIIFIFWERHQGDNAMFPPSIVTRPYVYWACITSFLQGGSLLFLSYYLPIWFQTILGKTPVGSAVATLPTFLSQIILSIVSGVMIPKLGYFTPWAIFGGAITAIGCGLMTTFKPSTATGEWIGYQILTGAGRGLSMQIPIQIIQNAVPRTQLAQATAVGTWAQFFGGALVTAVGQTALQNLLKNYVPKYTQGVDPQRIIEAGATAYRNVVPASQVAGVVKAYNKALTMDYFLAVSTATLSTLTAAGMGWKKIVKKTPPKTTVEEGKDSEVKDVEVEKTVSNEKGFEAVQEVVEGTGIGEGPPHQAAAAAAIVEPRRSTHSVR